MYFAEISMMINQISKKLSDVTFVQERFLKQQVENIFHMVDGCFAKSNPNPIGRGGGEYGMEDLAGPREKGLASPIPQGGIFDSIPFDGLRASLPPLEGRESSTLPPLQQRISATYPCKRVIRHISPPYLLSALMSAS
jgi:hypothetical protein